MAADTPREKQTNRPRWVAGHLQAILQDMPHPWDLWAHEPLAAVTELFPTYDFGGHER